LARPLTVFHSPDYAGGGFDTVAKAGAVADSLTVAPPAHPVELVAPEPATRSELVAVHDEGFVDAVLTGEPRGLASSAGLGWTDTFARSVLASTGGCRDAARVAWDHGVAGTLSSGLHHAGRSSGNGYCTFNGLVLAVHAFQALGAERVLVLDLDAHCGGGTHDIVGNAPGVVGVDVSVSSFDDYEPGPGWSLDLVDHAAHYLPTIEQRVAEVPAGVDAVVYNAGMDPHERCATGGLAGITTEVLADREALVRLAAAGSCPSPSPWPAATWVRSCRPMSSPPCTASPSTAPQPRLLGSATWARPTGRDRWTRGRWPDGGGHVRGAGGAGRWSGGRHRGAGPPVGVGRR
jgi:hypothetical protein